MSTPISATSPLAATPLLAAGSAPAGGSPLVNQALKPAAVRNGSPATQKAYAAALSFEDMLVQQLSQTLTASSGLDGSSGSDDSSSDGSDASDGSDSDSGDAGSDPLSSLVTQSLSDGVMSGGGLGLATQLMGELDPATAGIDAAQSTGASSSTSPGSATAGAAGDASGAAPFSGVTGGTSA